MTTQNLKYDTLREWLAEVERLQQSEIECQRLIAQAYQMLRNGSGYQEQVAVWLADARELCGLDGMGRKL